MRRRLATACALATAAWLLAAAPASALPRVVGASPEVAESERLGAEAELRDLERRIRALDEQLRGRRAQLRQRLRALSQLASGGYLSLVADPRLSPDGGSAGMLRHLMQRDLAELAALSDEARQLDAEHARRQAALAVILAQHAESAPATPGVASGFATRRGRLTRPVPGYVTLGFGPYRDDGGVELLRRGVEMRADDARPVRAAAEGVVERVVELRGLGVAVIVAHADGFRSVTARLREVGVRAGDPVNAGAPLGAAAAPTVYFELTQDGVPLNPTPWLQKP